MSPSGVDEPRTTRLPFEVSSVRTARGLVDDALVERDVEPEVIQLAHIVVGELVMNAVQHGRPDQDGRLEVTYQVHDHEALHFAVRDGGRVAGLRARMPDHTAPGGRGLGIVERLCRRWSYDTRNGTRVSAELALR